MACAGKGVNQFRKALSDKLALVVPSSRLQRVRRSASRWMSALKKTLMSRSFSVFLLGAGIFTACAAASMVSVVGTAVCAVGSIAATAAVGGMVAVTTLSRPKLIPFSIANYLVGEYSRNVKALSKMSGLPVLDRIYRLQN